MEQLNLPLSESKRTWRLGDGTLVELVYGLVKVPHWFVSTGVIQPTEEQITEDMPVRRQDLWVDNHPLVPSWSLVQVPGPAVSSERQGPLPTDKTARKEMPIARGVLDYFPRAIAAVANCSFVGNQQHNPGEPMHWAKEKSTDQADCIVRHLIERGKLDDDGLRHSAKLAWRALALLETELEAAE